MFKNIKFEKSKYPIIKIGFWIIIMGAVIAALMTMRYCYNKLEIKNLFSPIAPITVNIETANKINSDVFICYDDFCVTPYTATSISKVYYSKYTSEENNENRTKIKNIHLAYPSENKNFINNIDNIYINIGTKKYSYAKNELLKKEAKITKIEVSNANSNKKEIIDYNLIKISDVGNYNGILSNICSLFLSLFYNWNVFIIPYLWLFIAFMFYIFKKDEINFNLKISNKVAFISFILIGAILRLSQIGYYPLWTDEIYTKTMAIKNFYSCFLDAGNPPLFFILEYIITKILGTSNIILRILPCLFGILFIPATYLLLKNIDKKLALFGTFLATINTINIYYSTEARGYSLSMLLIVVGIYLLFNYLKNPTIKNLILYSLLSICAINTNYYLIFFIFTNFIWGIFGLIKNKNKKLILPFFIGNLIASLSFIPYLIVSYKTALNATFNTWIEPLSRNVFKYTINEYFINKYVFMFLAVIVLLNLIFAFVPKNLLERINIKINPQKKELYIYLVYSFTLILIIASLISIFVKPIFHKRVLISIYSLLFLIESISIVGIVEFIKENKIIKILKFIFSTVLLLTCFAITNPMPIREIYRTDDFMYILQNDAKKYINEYEIHAIDIDFIDYLKHYPEVKKMNIKWHFVNGNANKHLEKLNKFDYIDKNKKSIIYTHALAANIEKIGLFNPYATIYKSNTISILKIMYNPKENK